MQRLPAGSTHTASGGKPSGAVAIVDYTVAIGQQQAASKASKQQSAPAASMQWHAVLAIACVLVTGGSEKAVSFGGVQHCRHDARLSLPPEVLGVRLLRSGLLAIFLRERPPIETEDASCLRDGVGPVKGGVGIVKGGVGIVKGGVGIVRGGVGIVKGGVGPALK